MAQWINKLYEIINEKYFVLYSKNNRIIINWFYEKN